MRKSDDIWMTGPCGKARSVEVPSDPLSAILAQWFMHLPGAHPFWNCYVVSAIHLRDIEGQPPAVKHYPEAEYEVMVVALDPELKPVPENRETWRFLTPANVAIQFDGLDDEKAKQVPSALAVMCIQGALTPEVSDIIGGRELWKKAVTRVVDTLRYTHAEAFCVMTYRCKAGHETKVWNSRDGVTPFYMPCPECGGDAQHVNWQRDVRDPEHVPQRGEYVWIDTPESLKAPLARRQVARAKGTQFEIKDPEEIQRVVSQIVEAAEPGEPFLVRV